MELQIKYLKKIKAIDIYNYQGEKKYYYTSLF